jgi:hypothetical protein
MPPSSIFWIAQRFVAINYIRYVEDAAIVELVERFIGVMSQQLAHWEQTRNLPEETSLPF